MLSFIRAAYIDMSLAMSRRASTMKKTYRDRSCKLDAPDSIMGVEVPKDDHPRSLSRQNQAVYGRDRENSDWTSMSEQESLGLQVDHVRV